MIRQLIQIIGIDCPWKACEASIGICRTIILILLKLWIPARIANERK